MKIEKIVYRIENRFNIYIPTSRELNSLVKRLTKRKWSSTIHSWHLLYTKEAFRQLKSLFFYFGYEKKILEPETLQAITLSKTDSNLENFTLYNSFKSIILVLTRNVRLIQLYQVMHGCRWGKNQSCWIHQDNKQALIFHSCNGVGNIHKPSAKRLWLK